MLFAVDIGIRQMHVVEALEAASLAATVKRNETVYLATHGHWPTPGDPMMTANARHGQYVTDVQIGQNGNMTMRLRLSRTTGHRREPDTGVLLFRPHLLGVPGYQSVTLLCGYAQPVEPPHARATPNPTTLDRRDLPPFCR
ncbi:MAG TPA: hypothetical protein VFJ15_12805 [Oleiagrimonas sp.]|nr:hypothetical protein [Oleiagrimonas sp.]